jgi:hypothetical protein
MVIKDGKVRKKQLTALGSRGVLIVRKNFDGKLVAVFRYS